MKATLKRALRGTAVAVGAVLVALLLAEGILRIAEPDRSDDRGGPDPEDPRRRMLRPSSVPGLAYEMIPNETGLRRAVEVRSNSLGFRDDEIPMPKPAGRVRIAILGDSFTFGQGIEQNLVFPSVLETLLTESARPRGPTWDVVNLGLGGYSTRDEIVVLEHKVLPLDPDLVVLAYFLNDPDVEPLDGLHREFRRPPWWERLRLGRLVARARRGWEASGAARSDYFHDLHAHPRLWSIVLAGFRDLRRLTNDAGVSALVMILPEAPWADTWDDYAYRDLHEQVASAARDAGLPVLDMLDVLSAYPPRTLRLGPGNHHLNDLGHFLVASTLRATLIVREGELLRFDGPAWKEGEREAARKLLSADLGYGFTKSLLKR